MKRNTGHSLKSSMLKGNAALLVLITLRDAPAPGHIIASEVSRRSKQLLDFGEGSVYPLLHDLQSRGLVESEWEVRDGRRPVRVYRITQEGTTELEVRLAAWEEFSTGMEHIIRGDA